MADQVCPLCSLANPEVHRAEGYSYVVVCRRCVEFKITNEAWAAMRAGEPVDRRVLSGMARYEVERGGRLFLTTDNLQETVSEAPIPRNPLQAVDNLLLYIGDKAEKASGYVQIDDYSPPITVAVDPTDYVYVRDHLLKLNEIEFTDGNRLRLTIAGWERFRGLNEVRPNSNQGFAAMWFADELSPAWVEGIRPGLEDAGYTAVRLDAVEHNEKIDDRIIAEIRRSGLVVADLSGERANVYFEAGFAMGLGIPVIWTCRNDWRDKIHFDTRQYNYIGWETPAELRERLRLRIEATLPRKG